MTGTHNMKKPNALLDHVIETMHLKNDAALCRALEIMPPVASKIRKGVYPIGASIIIAIHELTGMEIKDIKAMIALGKEEKC